MSRILISAMVVAGVLLLSDAQAQVLRVDSEHEAAQIGGPLRQVTFEDVAIGTETPFTSLGVVIEEIGAPLPGSPKAVVLDQLLGNPHLNLFGLRGSPDRFLQSNLQFSVRFPQAVTVVGFALRSTACPDPGGIGSLMGWRIFNAQGAQLDSGVFALDEGCPNLRSAYFGLQASSPFVRVEFFRNGGSNFVVDDIQYGPITGLSASAQSTVQPAYVANFDDVQAGTSAPFVSGDLSFSGTPQVLDLWFGLPHTSIFGGFASPPNLMAANFGVWIEAPGDVQGIQFDTRGANCPAPYYASVEGYDTQQRQVDSVAFAVTGCGTGRVGVLGMRPARHLHLRLLRSAGGFINAPIDDLRLEPERLFGNGFEN
ncbi:MAG: hypothetical protein AB7E72_07580 [Lysobacterales bacterium]